ncbi:LysR substrate-binding domain-containing protein [Reinekea blandensis]|uniref:Transcriptional regulator n=1 Tax=Reinekea blandensis MED297 TaxID=314283 RepID=A4BB72_9GAMM|nr:LysR substrate-binding domain-containing protein [Reinekea blandensis]EAR10685.1 Transcriptional regulator [Reinekea sp. MED297] [Reinekea blandensis MED297]
MKYTLRQLEIFLAAAHHQSISKAAQELAMSQSAASESLRTLEAQFDLQLFDRAGKSLRLNDLGKQLRVRAEKLIDHARELESGFQQHSDIGRLTIGATLSIGNYLTIPLIAEFMKQHPSADIQLDVANTSSIVAKVRNFDLDIGLIEGERHEPDLDVIPWQEDHLVVFCNADHPLAQKGMMTEEDILNASWILREPGSGTRQTFDWAMHTVLSQLTIALELQHTEAIKRAVEANLGIGCLSALTLSDAFRRGNLVPLDVPGHNFRRFLYFILHKEKYRSAGISQWIDHCRRFQGHINELGSG